MSDIEIFEKQCSALEKNIPMLQKLNRLEDVDGSILQIYELAHKKIKVVCCEQIGTVYVESEEELKKYFQ